MRSRAHAHTRMCVSACRTRTSMLARMHACTQSRLDSTRPTHLRHQAATARQHCQSPRQGSSSKARPLLRRPRRPPEQQLRRANCAPALPPSRPPALPPSHLEPRAPTSPASVGRAAGQTCPTAPRAPRRSHPPVTRLLPSPASRRARTWNGTAPARHGGGLRGRGGWVDVCRAHSAAAAACLCRAGWASAAAAIRAGQVPCLPVSPSPVLLCTVPAALRV